MFDAFVYGTLLSGERAADLIDRNTDTDRTPGVLNSAGTGFLCMPPHEGYPAFITFDGREEVERNLHEYLTQNYPEACNIKGEIASCPDKLLHTLDQYEGYPHLYQREHFYIDHAADDEQNSLCFVYNMPFRQHMIDEGFMLIPSGDWRDRDGAVTLRSVVEEMKKHKEDILPRYVRTEVRYIETEAMEVADEL